MLRCQVMSQPAISLRGYFLTGQWISCRGWDWRRPSQKIDFEHWGAFDAASIKPRRTIQYETYSRCHTYFQATASFLAGWAYWPVD